MDSSATFINGEKSVNSPPPLVGKSLLNHTSTYSGYPHSHTTTTTTNHSRIASYVHSSYNTRYGSSSIMGNQASLSANLQARPNNRSSPTKSFHGAFVTLCDFIGEGSCSATENSYQILIKFGSIFLKRAATSIGNGTETKLNFPFTNEDGFKFQLLDFEAKVIGEAFVPTISICQSYQTNQIVEFAPTTFRLEIKVGLLTHEIKQISIELTRNESHMNTSNNMLAWKADPHGIKLHSFTEATATPSDRSMTPDRNIESVSIRQHATKRCNSNSSTNSTLTLSGNPISATSTIPNTPCSTRRTILDSAPLCALEDLIRQTAAPTQSNEQHKCDSVISETKLNSSLSSLRSEDKYASSIEQECLSFGPDTAEQFMCTTNCSSTPNDMGLPVASLPSEKLNLIDLTIKVAQGIGGTQNQKYVCEVRRKGSQKLLARTRCATRIDDSTDACEWNEKVFIPMDSEDTSLRLELITNDKVLVASGILCPFPSALPFDQEVVLARATSDFGWVTVACTYFFRNSGDEPIPTYSTSSLDDASLGPSEKELLKSLSTREALSGRLPHQHVTPALDNSHFSPSSDSSSSSSVGSVEWTGIAASLSTDSVHEGASHEWRRSLLSAKLESPLMVTSQNLRLPAQRLSIRLLQGKVSLGPFIVSQLGCSVHFSEYPIFSCDINGSKKDSKKWNNDLAVFPYNDERFVKFVVTNSDHHGKARVVGDGDLDLREFAATLPLEEQCMKKKIEIFNASQRRIAYLKVAISFHSVPISSARMIRAMPEPLLYDELSALETHQPIACNVFRQRKSIKKDPYPFPGKSSSGACSSAKERLITLDLLSIDNIRSKEALLDLFNVFLVVELPGSCSSKMNQYSYKCPVLSPGKRPTSLCFDHTKVTDMKYQSESYLRFVLQWEVPDQEIVVLAKSRWDISAVLQSKPQSCLKTLTMCNRKNIKTAERLTVALRLICESDVSDVAYSDASVNKVSSDASENELPIPSLKNGTFNLIELDNMEESTEADFFSQSFKGVTNDKRLHCPIDETALSVLSNSEDSKPPSRVLLFEGRADIKDCNESTYNKMNADQTPIPKTTPCEAQEEKLSSSAITTSTALLPATSINLESVTKSIHLFEKPAQKNKSATPLILNDEIQSIQINVEDSASLQGQSERHPVMLKELATTQDTLETLTPQTTGDLRVLKNDAKEPSSWKRAEKNVEERQRDVKSKVQPSIGFAKLATTEMNPRPVDIGDAVLHCVCKQVNDSSTGEGECCASPCNSSTHIIEVVDIHSKLEGHTQTAMLDMHGMHHALALNRTHQCQSDFDTCKIEVSEESAIIGSLKGSAREDRLVSDISDTSAVQLRKNTNFEIIKIKLGRARGLPDKKRKMCCYCRLTLLPSRVQEETSVLLNCGGKFDFAEDIMMPIKKGDDCLKIEVFRKRFTRLQIDQLLGTAVVHLGLAFSCWPKKTKEVIELYSAETSQNMLLAGHISVAIEFVESRCLSDFNADSEFEPNDTSHCFIGKPSMKTEPRIMNSQSITPLQAKKKDDAIDASSLEKTKQQQQCEGNLDSELKEPTRIESESLIAHGGDSFLGKEVVQNYTSDSATLPYSRLTTTTTQNLLATTTAEEMIDLLRPTFVLSKVREDDQLQIVVEGESECQQEEQHFAMKATEGILKNSNTTYFSTVISVPSEKMTNGLGQSSILEERSPSGQKSVSNNNDMSQITKKNHNTENLSEGVTQLTPSFYVEKTNNDSQDNEVALQCEVGHYSMESQSLVIADDQIAEEFSQRSIQSIPAVYCKSPLPMSQCSLLSDNWPQIVSGGLTTVTTSPTAQDRYLKVSIETIKDLCLPKSVLRLNTKKVVGPLVVKDNVSGPQTPQFFIEYESIWYPLPFNAKTSKGTEAIEIKLAMSRHLGFVVTEARLMESLRVKKRPQNVIAISSVEIDHLDGCKPIELKNVDGVSIGSVIVQFRFSIYN